MYKYQYCIDFKELQRFLDKANANGYVIIGVVGYSGFTIIYKTVK